MPRRASKAPPDPNTIFVAWQSFAAEVEGGVVGVKLGDRLRGDNAIVKAHTYFFVADGAPAEDVRNQQRDHYPELPDHVPSPHYTPPKPKLEDADAMVCITSVGGALSLGSLTTAGRPGVGTRRGSTRSTRSRGGARSSRSDHLAALRCATCSMRSASSATSVLRRDAAASSGRGRGS